jgi:hypothetical protein
MSFKITNSERALWVNNNESLYIAYIDFKKWNRRRLKGKSVMRLFIEEYKDTIDAIILKHIG